jgi:hypothetical protein
VTNWVLTPTSFNYVENNSTSGSSNIFNVGYIFNGVACDIYMNIWSYVQGAFYVDTAVGGTFIINPTFISSTTAPNGIVSIGNTVYQNASIYGQVVGYGCNIGGTTVKSSNVTLSQTGANYTITCIGGLGILTVVGNPNYATLYSRSYNAGNNTYTWLITMVQTTDKISFTIV